MSIQSEINRINTAVSGQETLIGEVVDVLAARCVVTEPLLQARTVTPTEEVQVVTPDAGYDGLSSVTVEAAQGGEGTYGWRKSTSRLPSGYTEVEYIQSSGTQYIDTGFAVTSSNLANLRFEIDQAIISGTNISVSGSGGTTPIFYIGTIGGTIYYGNGTADTSTGVAYDYTRRTFVADPKNGKVTVTDLVDISVTFNATSGSKNLYLFGYNTGSGASMHATKVYGCKIYENGTLKRDFVPCINASGAAGLYDLVNGVFYGNNGSGSFTVGASTVGSVVGYVVSDDANAYPDGAFLDGYYYEKL